MKKIKVEKIDTSLPGVWELRPKVHADSRGYFMETYQQEDFANLGITDTFVQENQSYSVEGTLRGLHYQLVYPQAKLCRVIDGEVLDVVADIRPDSPHFGKTAAVLLSAKENNQIYVPTGFAHGFLVLRGPAQFLYKCSAFYHGDDEYGIVWNDPNLAIAWNFENPLLSDKDRKLPFLSELVKKSPEKMPRYQKP